MAERADEMAVVISSLEQLINSAERAKRIINGWPEWKQNAPATLYPIPVPEQAGTLPKECR